MQRMYCPSCGREMAATAGSCPGCGAPNGAVRDSSPDCRPADASTAIMVNRRHDGLAMLMSLFIPGLGQLYDGQVRRAAVFVLEALLIFALMTLSSYLLEGTLALVAVIAFAVAYAVFVAFAVYDAYRLAREYNRYLLRNGGKTPW